jgi:hypothetical protein
MRHDEPWHNQLAWVFSFLKQKLGSRRRQLRRSICQPSGFLLCFWLAGDILTLLESEREARRLR